MLLPVPQLSELLPKGYSVMEDEDTLTVRCAWCGWERAWYCRRATPLSVQATVAVHHRGCPGHPPGA